MVSFTLNFICYIVSVTPCSLMRAAPKRGNHGRSISNISCFNTSSQHIISSPAPASPSPSPQYALVPCVDLFHWGFTLASFLTIVPSFTSQTQPHLFSLDAHAISRVPCYTHSMTPQSSPFAASPIPKLTCIFSNTAKVMRSFILF